MSLHHGELTAVWAASPSPPPAVPRGHQRAPASAPGLRGPEATSRADSLRSRRDTVPDRGIHTPAPSRFISPWCVSPSSPTWLVCLFPQKTQSTEACDSVCCGHWCVPSLKRHLAVVSAPHWLIPEPHSCCSPSSEQLHSLAPGQGASPCGILSALATQTILATAQTPTVGKTSEPCHPTNSFKQDREKRNHSTCAHGRQKPREPRGLLSQWGRQEKRVSFLRSKRLAPKGNSHSSTLTGFPHGPEITDRKSPPSGPKHSEHLPEH